MTPAQDQKQTIAYLERRFADRPAVGALSEEARTALLKSVGIEWKRRVGTLITKRMSRRQFAGFKRAMDAGDADLCRRLIREAAPDSDDVVRGELQKLIEEVERSASLLLGLDAARGRNRPL